MYERFTDRARKVMQVANQEAQKLNHEYIGTEHIVLGLIQEIAGVSARVLESLGVKASAVNDGIRRLVMAGPPMVTMGKLPQTPRAKSVIQFAMQEASELNHNYVGTEHLLLGLLREEEGVASQVLRECGASVDAVREAIKKMLGDGIKPQEIQGVAFTISVANDIGASLAIRQQRIDTALRVLEVTRPATGQMVAVSSQPSASMVCRQAALDLLTKYLSE